MRILLAIIFSIFLIIPSFADYASADSTVRIRAMKNNRIAGYGSGTYIGNKMILTAAHVAGYKKDETPLGWDLQFGYQNKVYNAKVVWADTDYDLAVIRFEDDLDIQAVPISCEPTPIGTELRADGFPLKLGKVTTWGRVSSKAHEEGPWKEINIVTMVVVMGQSGAGVMDQEGHLRGVLVGIPGIPGPGEEEAYLLGWAFVVTGSAVCEARYFHESE